MGGWTCKSNASLSECLNSLGKLLDPRHWGNRPRVSNVYFDMKSHAATSQSKVRCQILKASRAFPVLASDMALQPPPGSSASLELQQGGLSSNKTVRSVWSCALSCRGR